MSDNLGDLDFNQILKKMVDAETMSVKVLPQLSGEINIELSAQDGDSVSVQPICGAVQSLQSGQVLDVSNARSLFISSTSPMASLLVSLDQETWHQLDADKAFFNVENAAFKFLKVVANNSVKVMIKG
jgi:hypothetical protein